jgi:hypothetical protein
MRPIILLTAIVAASGLLLASLPSDAQTRQRGAKSRTVYANPSQPPRARITVRRARTYLDAGTEVGPMTKSYTDYARSPLHAPYRHYDPTSSFRSPLPDTWSFPGYW